MIPEEQSFAEIFALVSLRGRSIQLGAVSTWDERGSEVVWAFEKGPGGTRDVTGSI